MDKTPEIVTENSTYVCECPVVEDEDEEIKLALECAERQRIHDSKL